MTDAQGVNIVNNENSTEMTFDQLVTTVRRESRRISTDSRSVRAGDVFVAIAGRSVDGHRFIQDAQAQGAEYVVCATLPSDMTPERMVVVDSPAKAAATLAQASLDYPTQKLVNLGVTGTNGKTTVATLTQACLEAAGKAAGLIGTICYDTGAEREDAPLTTPDACSLAGLQSRMVRAGREFMVIEASSHALHQDRLAGIEFAAAAFTNLTGDHLDYHQTEKKYLAAKATLFTGLGSGATAILNADSPHSAQLARLTDAQVLTYGIDGDADLRASIHSLSVTGTTYTLHHGAQSARVRSPLLGRHNVSNHLAAAGLCLAVGVDLSLIAKGLSELTLVPGRLERVEADLDFSILIDYAHTDDALGNVLTTLRPLCSGRLIVLFGCGGERDRSKRPRMARIARANADLIIITSDNPRTEAPQKIIDEIRSGLSCFMDPSVFVEVNRKKAIQFAIDKAKTNDIVLLAGKGHETYQVIGEKRIAFSDKEVALASIKSLTTQ
ncbi:MAG: UDP-N-acetylmuramoyl-L-alanyl-D-glutamate--2,6-diaminopimelate ligase [Planctomycetes bacterium]|nr:UDP-N-acetylmuramoyl-L-alanyl-D-glutamate--2,6-diaminopimelate ligase [Planctomycetota bacterium]